MRTFFARPDYDISTMLSQLGQAVQDRHHDMDECSVSWFFAFSLFLC